MFSKTGASLGDVSQACAPWAGARICAKNMSMTPSAAPDRNTMIQRFFDIGLPFASRAERTYSSPPPSEMREGEKGYKEM
jgi:hypothetical protein